MSKSIFILFVLLNFQVSCSQLEQSVNQEEKKVTWRQYQIMMGINMRR